MKSLPVLICLPFIFLTNLRADTITLGTAEAGTVVPFFFSTELQQIYDASLFTGGMNISQISFFRRPSGGNPDINGEDIDDVTYTLSLATTNAAPNALTNDLNQNRSGLTLQTVFSSTLTKTTGYTGNETVDFDTSSFTYDPTAGNLFLQIAKSSNTGDGDLTIQRSGLNQGLGSVEDFTNSSNAHGLVTRFTFTSTPEPSSLASLAAFSLLLLRRRR